MDRAPTYGGNNICIRCSEAARGHLRDGRKGDREGGRQCEQASSLPPFTQTQRWRRRPHHSDNATETNEAWPLMRAPPWRPSMSPPARLLPAFLLPVTGIFGCHLQGHSSLSLCPDRSLLPLSLRSHLFVPQRSLPAARLLRVLFASSEPFLPSLPQSNHPSSELWFALLTRRRTKHSFSLGRRAFRQRCSGHSSPKHVLCGGGRLFHLAQTRPFGGREGA